MGASIYVVLHPESRMHKVFFTAYFGKPCGTSPRLGDTRADLVLSDVAPVLVGARVRADVLGPWYVEVSMNGSISPNGSKWMVYRENSNLLKALSILS